MSELRERLREAAEAAVREGRTPPAAALVGRGRRRRRRRVAGAVAALAVVVGAVTVGTDRLAVPTAPLAPPASTIPPTTTAAAGSGPDVSIPPDPGRVETPVGRPPGRVGRQMVQDVASELTRCRGGDPDAPKVLVAWGSEHDRTWLILARPPRPGETWLCWAEGLFDAGGAGGLGNEGGPDVQLTPIRASGSQNIRSGGAWWGQIIGTVPKEAARVRVLFHQGIAPLDLAPIRSGDRFPRNFFVGFYRQPQEEKHLQWYVAGVVAYDRTGRKVAECSADPGPGHSC